jgi:hypothetical protein
MTEVEFDKRYSWFIAEYLGYRFKVPMYPWEALEPYWASIAIAISKTLVYNRFSPEVYKDHKLWRENRMGLEALRFADMLTRDRDFRRAVKEFNAQAPMLKFQADWIQPFETGQSVDFWNHLAQLGQLIYNSVKFLRDAEYLIVYGDLVKVIRPYWCPPAEWALRRDWAEKTIKFIENFYDYTGKYPSLRAIAEYWRVPRYTLIEAGFTMEAVRDMYRHYRKTGEIKIIKAEKEYKVLSEEEQRQLAVKIAKRVYLH